MLMPALLAVAMLAAAGEVFWDDMRAPVTAINPPGLEADPDVDTSVPGLLFDKAATETVHIILQLPHDFACADGLHCEICPHVHWEPAAAGAGEVLWRIAYQWRNNAETLGDWATLDALATANGTADKLQIDGFGCISKPDARASSLLEMRLSRIGGDETDDYDDDARLKEFDAHYKRARSKPGTIYEYTDDP
jgi:hypothetical protein